MALLFQDCMLCILHTKNELRLCHPGAMHHDGTPYHEHSVSSQHACSSLHMMVTSVYSAESTPCASDALAPPATTAKSALHNVWSRPGCGRPWMVQHLERSWCLWDFS